MITWVEPRPDWGWEGRVGEEPVAFIDWCSITERWEARAYVWYDDNGEDKEYTIGDYPSVDAAKRGIVKHFKQLHERLSLIVGEEP